MTPWLSPIHIHGIADAVLLVLLASPQKFALSTALGRCLRKLLPLAGFEDYAAYQAIAYLPGPHSY